MNYFCRWLSGSDHQSELNIGAPKIYSTIFSRLFSLSAATLLVTVGAAYGGTVKCNNNSGDASLIQSAANGGGVVTISGTCAMNAPISINNALTINGSGNPHLNFPGGDSFHVFADGVTINGITIDNGAMQAPPCCGPGTLNHFTFTNNTLQNITSGQPDSFAAGILYYATITGNKFTNLWSGGYPNQQNANPDVWTPGGVHIYGDMVYSTVSNNIFDEIASDAFNINGQNTGSGNTPAPLGINNVLSGNEFIHVHRANVEMQSHQQNFTVASNYIHDEAMPYWNSYGFTLAINGSDGITFINNTGTVNSNSVGCIGFLPTFLESAGSPYLVQGNVASTLSPLAGCGANTWGGVAQGGGTPGQLDTYQNNVFCGSSYITSIGLEGDGSNAGILDQYNYKNVSGCPAGSNLTSSNIVPVFTSADDQYFPTGGTGTWTLAVVSNLSIRNVQFFIDTSTSPVATQVIQDLNENFANDTKWLYHATLNTSTIGGGAHTITAKMTDVAGATQKVSQPFTVDYVGTPVAQVSPTALSFGSEPQGSKTAAEVVTLKNTGTASLVVNSISITGADPSDFGLISSCGSTLASSSSCTIAITFKPVAVGSRSASLSIVDDAAGSPQSVSLTGTGTTPQGSPTVVNHSMSLNTWFWDAGEYYWSGDTQLLLFPTYTPNPNQDFQFTSVAGVTNGWTICKMGSTLCLSDSGSAGTGGYVTLGSTADTWVETTSGTLKNLRTHNFLAYPAGTVGNGTPVVTGSSQSAWVFGPTH